MVRQQSRAEGEPSEVARPDRARGTVPNRSAVLHHEFSNHLSFGKLGSVRTFERATSEIEGDVIADEAFVLTIAQAPQLEA
jgi:hypothetical protein